MKTLIMTHYFNKNLVSCFELYIVCSVFTLYYIILEESNTSLYNNLEHFVQSTINEAGKSLDSIEQHLLKSQITLQGAVSSLKLLSVNSLTLKNKLHSLLSSKFLNNVTVTKDENVCSSTDM